MPRLKPISGGNNPCLNCPPIVMRLKMNRKIGVGFGIAGVTCNGKEIWSEGPEQDWPDLPTVMKFENAARKKRGDWRIVMHGPLHGETYQRQGRNNWVLVEKNKGFA